MNTPTNTTAPSIDSDRKPMLALVIAALMTSPAFLAGCSSTPKKPIVSASSTPLQASPSIVLESTTTETDIDQKHSAINPDLIAQENTTISELVSSTTQTASPPDDDSVLMEIEETHYERPAKTTFKFGFDQQQLPAEEMDVVVQHGRFLSQHPEKKIQIHGHADAQGAPSYNQFLAKQRANHVAELLKQAGVQAAQIEIVSWGSDKPMASGTHWKDHRRVEMLYDEAFVVQNQTSDELSSNVSN